MNAKTKEAVVKHGEDLKKLFGLDPSLDPVVLCKKVRRIESKAHQFATDYCNGLVNPCEDEDVDRACKTFLDKLDAILGFKKTGLHVFVNLDARGYALKIDDKMPLDFARDWGSYGIIAPDLTQ